MKPQIALITDRSHFDSRWREALEPFELAMHLAPPAHLGDEARQGNVLVIDGSSGPYAVEDELLAEVAMGKALNCVVAVELVEGASAGLTELLEDMCDGHVAPGMAHVRRVARALGRSLNTTRGQRFEFVTVSSKGDDVLAVFGDGHVLGLQRPLGDGVGPGVEGRDDRSPIVRIELTNDARGAALTTDKGERLLMDAVWTRSASTVRDRPRRPHLSGPQSAPNSAPSPASPPRAAQPVGGAGHPPLQGKELGQRLRALRLEAGLTQAELARRTGIHRPNIARVEAGRHTPSLETVQRLAEAIGVSAAQVFK